MNAILTMNQVEKLREVRYDIYKRMLYFKYEREGLLMDIQHIFPQSFLDTVINRQQTEQSLIIDVREQHEWDYYHLPDSIHMPMRQIPNRLSEIPQDQHLYIICAHGVRSAVVTDFLLNQNYTKVYNVAGGMAAVCEILGYAYD
jgi:rhodanese-related sulfurtransferase